MLRTINQEQISSLIRTIIQVIAGITGWTFLDDNTLISSLAGLVLAGVTIYGSIYKRTDANLILTGASVPATKEVIVASEALVKSDKMIDNPKVVSSTGV